MIKQLRYGAVWLIWLGLGVMVLKQADTSYHAKFQQTQNLNSPPLLNFEPSTIEILTFGHSQVYQDFLQIWMIQSLSGADADTDSPELLQTILLRGALHGVTIESYFMAGCFTLAYRFKRPDLCFSVMEAGLRANPESWRLPSIQGYVEYFLLKDPVRAAFFYSLTSSRKDAPAHIKSFVKKIINQERITISELEENMTDVLNVEDNKQLHHFFEELSQP